MVPPGAADQLRIQARGQEWNSSEMRLRGQHLNIKYNYNDPKMISKVHRELVEGGQNGNDVLPPTRRAAALCSNWRRVREDKVTPKCNNNAADTL